ncbi:MAG: hypothetical protein OWT28_06800 [Firmicutes bacterium]|nr:hypothetical protein [Bacillota bacterium]
MRFYLVSADLFEARQAAALGFVQGVYVPRNPVARTGRDYAQLVSEISRLSMGIVGVQAEAFDAESLAAEARAVSRDSQGHIAFVMPMTLESVRAVRSCYAERVLPSLQFVASPVQALVAAQAGASAILLDAVVLGEAGIPVAPLVTDIKRLFHQGRLRTDILVESARDVAEVGRVAVAGADGVLCNWDVLQTLAYHPLSDQGIERLLAEREPV